MKQALRLAAAIALVSILAACAAGSDEAAHAASGGLISKFFLGLWHGIIGPITLLVEIINGVLPNILPWHAHLYETKAAGGAYDLGFYLGFGGGPFVVFRRWPRRR
jgi:hypothetical protein